MLPTRRRDLYWQEPAALRASCFRPPAGFFTHSVRHLPARMVASRREAGRDDPGSEEADEPDFYDNSDETYWIPYCLSFLSRYPLYNPAGRLPARYVDPLEQGYQPVPCRGGLRILSFPAPRLNDLVRIDMKDYALLLPVSFLAHWLPELCHVAALLLPPRSPTLWA